MQQNCYSNLFLFSNLLQQTFLLYIAIGIAWIFGLLQVGPYCIDGEWINYAFVILGAVQGRILDKYGSGDNEQEGKKDIMKLEELEDKIFIKRVPVGMNYIFGGDAQGEGIFLERLPKGVKFILGSHESKEGNNRNGAESAAGADDSIGHDGSRDDQNNGDPASSLPSKETQVFSTLVDKIDTAKNFGTAAKKAFTSKGQKNE